MSWLDEIGINCSVFRYSARLVGNWDKARVSLDLADLVGNLLLLGQVVAHHVSTRSAAAAVAADKAFGEMGT